MEQIARRLLAAVIAAVLALAFPAAATAHAELVAASPGPGIGLAQAPAAVVIKFSEPLNLSLSRIAVLDASGDDVGTGTTDAVTGDPDAMQRRLGLLTPGQYTVRWTSVSSLDGHTLRGSYSFAVGTAASPETSIANSPIDSEGPLGLVGRFVALLSLGLWFGSLMLARPARRAELDAVTVARLRRAAPGVAFVGIALALVSSSLVATGSLAGLEGVVASSSGTARVVELAAVGMGFLLPSRWLVLGAVLAVAAIVAEAASGHAASSVSPPLGIASFAIHLGAVGVWTFAIAGSLVAAPHVRRALGTFTRYAVTAAAITAATGLVNAVLELARPADLIETGYGLAIVAKSFAFVLMAGFGLAHFTWRRRTGVADSALRGPVRAEASAALAALLIATLLVGFPNPPREAEAAEELTAGDPVLAQLGSSDALSLGYASGPFVVGLTILPPRVGQAQIRVTVLGVEAGDALRDARFTASTPGAAASADLSACGLGCFAGTTTFPRQGDWRMALYVASNRGAIEVADTVPLPTPDGGAEFARALTAIERLKSARLDEKLKGSVGGRTYETTYRFQAPDRTEYSISGTTTIIIGRREYTRSGDGPWKEQPFPSPGFSWPTAYYRQFWQGAAAVRVLAADRVDGVRSTVISFVRPDVRAWFRIWVGTSDGLIRRQEMRAEGHLMDHSYADLNRTPSVEPPG